MNAGIADATNLAWMLAGVLNGWADPAILAAHEAERRPITEQVSHYAMGTARWRWRASAPRCRRRSRTPGPDGDAARGGVGRAVVALNTPQYLLRRTEFRLVLRRLADHRL